MKDYYIQEYGAIKTNLGYRIPNKNLTEKQKTEVLMELVYQSNLIEGISKYWIKTYSKGEEIKPKYELENHFRAYKYMLNRKEKQIEEKDIHNTHHLIMQNLNIETKKFREVNNYLVNQFGEVINTNPKPEEIKWLIDKLIIKENKSYLNREEVLTNHYFFEIIHPYLDGNGRTGRVLLNWSNLKNNNEFYLIQAKNKNEYYKEIQKYRKIFIKENPNIKFG